MSQSDLEIAKLSAENLARRFHETYERLAPQFSYETRKESAVPWERVTEKNRQLMVAVCDELMGIASTVAPQPALNAPPSNVKCWTCGGNYPAMIFLEHAAHYKGTCRNELGHTADCAYTKDINGEASCTCIPAPGGLRATIYHCLACGSDFKPMCPDCGETCDIQLNRNAKAPTEAP